MKHIYFSLFLLIIFNNNYAQKDTIYIYGPGGPYPAIKEAAEKFEKRNSIKIIVTKGPLKNWQNKASLNADLIYSGSEYMMSIFSAIFPSEFVPETIYPLYFRKSGLLVRKGNPKNIRSLNDLANPDLKIMVVNGAGLTGMWEDMIGRMKNISILRGIRKNIKVYAEDSGSAEKQWKENNDIDVWITWNIWQVANEKFADFVPVKSKYTIYRDCGITLTKRGNINSNVIDFYNYLKSDEAKPIFKKWGWE